MRRRLAAALVVAALALGTAGCAGDGPTRCGTDGCTITFPRTGDTTVSVLGMEARVVGVQDGAAVIEVAGQRVTVPVGGEAQVGGFTVGVEQVTDAQVVVRIRPA